MTTGAKPGLPTSRSHEKSQTTAQSQLSSAKDRHENVNGHSPSCDSGHGGVSGTADNKTTSAFEYDASAGMRKTDPRHPSTTNSTCSYGSASTGPSSAASSRKSKVGQEVATFFASGIGFLADAYGFFVIDGVFNIIAKTAVSDIRNDHQKDKRIIVTSTLIGAVMGQMGFGICADAIGRRAMFLSTATLVTCGAIASALVGFGYTHNRSSFSIYHQLALCRFFLGLGIGGEYPLSAAIASEASTEDAKSNQDEATSSLKRRTLNDSRFWWFLVRKPNSLAAVFTMQGVGLILSSLVIFIFLSLDVPLEITWRLAVAMGALPSSVALYFRWRMHETKAFKQATRYRHRKERYSMKRLRLSVFGRANGNTKYDDNENDVQPNVEDLGNITPTTTQTVSAREPEDRLSSILENTRQESLSHPTQTQSANDAAEGSIEAHYFSAPHTSGPGAPFSDCHTNTNIPVLQTVEKPFVSDNTGIQPKRKARGFKVFMQHVRNTGRTLYKYRYSLVASALPWFLMDITLYSSASYKTELGEELLRYLKASTSVSTAITRETLAGVLISLLGFPGYLLSVFFIHKTGLRRLQLFGFYCVTAAFGGLALNAFLGGNIAGVQIALIGLTFLFTNFGPNTTIYILPTQLYPTAVRATCHGFSAAMGKAGAALGTSLFTIIKDNWGKWQLYTIMGLVTITGAAVTHIFVPTDEDAKKQLEEAEREERHYRHRKAKKDFENLPLVLPVNQALDSPASEVLPQKVMAVEVSGDSSSPVTISEV